MKWLSLCVLIVSTNLSIAQSEIQLLEKALKLERTVSTQQGLLIYKSILKKNPRNLDALKRASLAAARLAQLEKSSSLKKAYINTAAIYANTAYSLNKKDDQSVYVQAISLGLTALIAPPKEKVMIANKIEQKINECIALNPTHPYIYHLKGKFYYEMSQLNSLERSLAKIFYGEIPNGSIDMAITNFMKCYKLDPNFVVNLSDMGLAYHKNKQDKLAYFYLSKGLGIPEYYAEDYVIKKEMKALLSKLDLD